MVYGDCLSFIPNGSSAADAAQPLESVSMKMRARVAIQHDQQHGRNKYLYTNKSLSTTYKPLSLVLKRIYIVLSLWNKILFRLLFVIFVCIHLRDPSQNPDEWYFVKKPSCICCRTLGTPADTLPMRNHTSIISAIACWCGSYWVQCSRAVILSSLHGHRCALYIYIFEYNVN